jgi:hypothetical protein
MTPTRTIRTTLAVLAAAVALAVTGLAAPAEAIDNVCSQYCWTLSYPAGCTKACKLPDGSLTTCGDYLQHPRCGYWPLALAADGLAAPADGLETLTCVPAEPAPAEAPTRAQAAG